MDIPAACAVCWASTAWVVEDEEMGECRLVESQREWELLLVMVYLMWIRDIGQHTV